jgi:hypothetical protein
MKTPAYFDKYTDKQKQEFHAMAAKGTNKNDIKSFLTACNKSFESDYTIVKCGTVTHKDQTLCYSFSNKVWYPLG